MSLFKKIFTALLLLPGIVSAAPVYFTGFEGGNDTSAPPYQNSTATTQFSIQGTTVKTGSFALKISPTNTTNPSWIGLSALDANGTYNPNNVDNLYAEFDYQYESGIAANNECIAQCVERAGGTVKLELRRNSSGNIEVYDKDLSLVATGTTNIVAGTWFRISGHCSTGAAATYEVKINGVTEPNLSGTANQQTAQAAAWNFGKCANRNSQQVVYYYDNIILDDGAFPGPNVVVKAVVPRSNGALSAWSGGTNASNHLEVDETPADADTTYIASTGNAGDAHTMLLDSTTTAGITGTIYGFIGVTKTKEASAVSSSYSVRIRSGSTNSDTTAEDRDTTYRYRQKLAAVDPATSATWTLSGIDAVEVGGIEANAVVMRTTFIRGMVAYTPSSGGGSKMLLRDN